MNDFTMLGQGNIFGDKQLKIIRRAGQLNWVELDGGRRAIRQETIFIKDIGLIKTTPYDNHFVFRHRFGDRGWTLFCTCGSPAAVFNYDAYKQHNENVGAMVMCMHHVMFNKHADGSA